MTSPHLIAAIIGIGLSLSIIYLVRQDHISPRVAARWFFVSVIVLIIGMAPEIVDYVGVRLGIGYPPIIPVLLAISAALLKILLMDIEKQKMQTKIDRLSQKISIMESMIDNESNLHKLPSSKQKERKVITPTVTQ